MDTIERIRDKLSNNGGSAKVPLLRGNKHFNVILLEDGVLVDNLSKESFLPWKVFEKTIDLLNNNNGRAQKGDSMGFKLGDERLSLESIEGYIAKEVYGKDVGDSVFRRITPITNILIWAGICENGKGELKLKR